MKYLIIVERIEYQTLTYAINANSQDEAEEQYVSLCEEALIDKTIHNADERITSVAPRDV